MVLFLNKKKLQEQKPLVNNTYQGKYDYSQMQYLPEDQRFGFDTLVEVARDTNKKSLWDIFSKKPKMVFPVGEGMSEEETKKAKEILSKEDLAVKAYREGSFFTRPTAGFYDPMASGFMKDTEIALQTLFSPKSTREEKIESFDFLMQPIISASQPLQPASGKIPTTTPKGKIKSSVLKIFAKEKNPLSIERSLRQIGIDDINAKSLSFDLAKANTADEVGDVLVAFSNKPLSIASKNVVDDVASGVTKQATSISDDLAKLKPQTDDLLAEARKYKSAEEFVKAQGITKDYVAEVKPTKLRADDRSVFKTAGEARGNAREITNKEIEIAGRDQKIFDANKDKTIPQLQKEIAESKKWADENSVSYPRSIQVKEEIIKTKSQLTDIWNKAQGVDPLIQEAEILRGTKGMTADDIMATYPNIKLKRDIPATTISGVKTTIKEGEKLTPYELKGNKILLQDGKTYIVSKNQFQNIKGQSVVAEGKPFAPELKQTEETVKGGEIFSPEVYNKYVEDLKKKYDPTGRLNMSMLYDELPKAEQDKFNKMKKSQDAARDMGTKYANYTLPGGENYKEILIKAPNQEISNNFKSDHWDEPNVISHIRLNERTYKGKKVTFMEELQSDWAREARAKGTINPDIKEPTLPEGWRMVSNGDTFQVVNKQGVPVPDKLYGTSGAYGGNKDIAIAKATGDDAFLKSKESGIPNNPNLKNWQELSVKRALKEAVDNDADYFAWINGEQTSARYNLATHLDNVKWSKSTPKKVFADDVVDKKDIGTHIELKAKGGTQIIINVDKNGLIKDASTSDWNGKKLDEVLGKGLADKIMAKESGTLSGEGLKFGGEWASNLYDRQVKNIVEKLTGQKVEMLDMGLPIEKAQAEFKILTRPGGGISRKLEIADLKTGNEIIKSGDKYIITDILGDGKFKAVPKSSVESPYSDWKEMMKLNPQLENLKETFDISQKTTQQQGIKLTPEVKNKIKGIAPEIKTSGNMFEVKTEEIKSEIPKPSVVSGETFEFAGNQVLATAAEKKAIETAIEKAEKLTPGQQEQRIETLENLDLFQGNTEMIEAELEYRNLSPEDMSLVILEDGNKLSDIKYTIRNDNGSLATTITKEEIETLKSTYTGEVADGYVEQTALSKSKDIATGVVSGFRVPYVFFKVKGLSSIYDPLIAGERASVIMVDDFLTRFKDSGLFKKGGIFTADSFNISKKEASDITKYYYDRQFGGLDFPIEKLSEKAQDFIKVFDGITNDTLKGAQEAASIYGKDIIPIPNYAPMYASKDIKFVGEAKKMWTTTEHPYFASLLERKPNVPLDVYEQDYRKTALEYMRQVSTFVNMAEPILHTKNLLENEEFSRILNDRDYDIVKKWFQDVYEGKSQSDSAKAITTVLQYGRRAGSLAYLGGRYSTVLKQPLNLIATSFTEGMLPKLKSKYAKDFNIEVKKLPSYVARAGDIAIEDLQGRVGRIFTGALTEMDREVAFVNLNAFLDREYNKFIEKGIPVTEEVQRFIEKEAQDMLDLWHGGFLEGQRPEYYRSEAGKLVLMFTYQLASQANGFYFKALSEGVFGAENTGVFKEILEEKSKGKLNKDKLKTITSIFAGFLAIGYLEQVITNLSFEWSTPDEMAKEVLEASLGNIPAISGISYSLATGKDVTLSPVFGMVSELFNAIYKGDLEEISWASGNFFGVPKQIKKTKEGLEVLARGGLTDKNGQMLAPVEGVMEQIRTFLNGRYGSVAAKDYMNNNPLNKKEGQERRWFVPQVEFLQNGDYERKAELYLSFSPKDRFALKKYLTSGQKKKLDNALKGITPKSEGRKSLSDIFK